MPRHARLDVPGTLHHVMVRGIEGSNIFRDEEDRKAFVDRVRSLVRDSGTRILAWELMDNHVHPLLISGPVGLSIRELGLPPAEIARQVGVGTTGVAMAVRKLTPKDIN